MNPLLPDDIVWTGEHLSEVALTALADGQDDALPPRAREHVSMCALCMQGVGAAAMLSTHVDVAITSIANAHAHATEQLPEHAEPRRPFPVAAFVAALVLGMLGALPAIGETPGHLAETAEVMLRALPHAVHGAVVVFRSGSDAIAFASVVSSVVLVLAGLAVARAMPRPLAA